MNRSTWSVTIRIEDANKDDNSYSDFTGESERAYTDYEFPCLFTRILDDSQREKHGLTEDINAVIHLAPKHLEDKIGFWKLDHRKVKIIFNDDPFLASRIVNLGYNKNWNACYGVEIRLKDDIRG